MSEIVGVTMDCADVDRMAAFWASVLGITAAADRSLRSCVLDVPAGDRQLRLTFRRVGSAKVTANRLRLCLQTADLHTETARLLSIGAIRLASGTSPVSWALLADIEGNEFDLIAPEDGGSA